MLSGNVTVAGALRGATVTADNLTADRVALVTTGGQLTDDSDLTFSGSTLHSTNTTVYSSLKSDTISERTSAAGVTIDSVLLKDGYMGKLKGDTTAWLFSSLAPLGTNQGTAAPIVSMASRIDGADSTKGVRLPAATAGVFIILTNNSSSQTVEVYPASGENISGAGGANLPVTLGAVRMMIFMGLTTGYWVYIT